MIGVWCFRGGGKVMLTSGANVITGRSWGVCSQFIDVDGKNSRQPLRLTSLIKPLSLIQTPN